MVDNFWSLWTKPRTILKRCVELVKECKELSTLRGKIIMKLNRALGNNFIHQWPEEQQIWIKKRFLLSLWCIAIKRIMYAVLLPTANVCTSIKLKYSPFLGDLSLNTTSWIFIHRLVSASGFADCQSVNHLICQTCIALHAVLYLAVHWKSSLSIVKKNPIWVDIQRRPNRRRTTWRGSPFNKSLWVPWENGNCNLQQM